MKQKNEEDNCLDQNRHLFMASNNQERCIYLIPPAVYNDHDKKREKEMCIHWRFSRSFSYVIIIDNKG